MSGASKPSTGRRKEAVARVKLVPGSGKMTVNGRPMEQYLQRETLVTKAVAPLVLTNNAGKFDMIAYVKGGGMGGQAGALRMGIARELVRIEPSAKGPLGKEGMLTRDARMKERKKYGQPGARKRFQFSKR
jgi:small subunit ribosomal protein S9